MAKNGNSFILYLMLQSRKKCSFDDYIMKPVIMHRRKMDKALKVEKIKTEDFVLVRSSQYSFTYTWKIQSQVIYKENGMLSYLTTSYNY